MSDVIGELIGGKSKTKKPDEEDGSGGGTGGSAVT
jgi:hypothetical protein